MNDFEERVSLESLDPGAFDPGFWVRFHSHVLDRAQMELARRRVNGDLTISDVVCAWRRALVPMALLAAAASGVLLLSQEEPAAPLAIIALEEALVEGLEGETIPTILGREGELEEVAFLTSVGGF
jgi:hypothetical protein